MLANQRPNKAMLWHFVALLRQHGREGKERRCHDDPDCIISVQPAPWPR